MANKHSFKFVIPDLDRTTTKAEWYAITHWLRLVRREVEGEMLELEFEEAVLRAFTTGNYKIITNQ